MSSFTSGTHRLPRARVDPIGDERTALALLHAAAARPSRYETILVLLDDARCGIGLVVVSDTVDADAVLEVAERVLDPAVHGADVSAVVIASVRPGGPIDGRDVLADADRWLHLDEIAEQACVDLVEWFVLGDGVSRPRELVGAVPRW